MLTCRRRHKQGSNRPCFSSAGDALWVKRASLRLVAQRNGLYSLRAFLGYPTQQWICLFSNTLFFLCRGCPLGSEGVLKTCNPKKWVVQPKGFATIPHSTVNRPFFKRPCLSSAGDALWVQRASLRLVTPRNGLYSLRALQQYPTQQWTGHFSKDPVFPLQGMPFGFRGHP